MMGLLADGAKQPGRSLLTLASLKVIPLSRNHRNAGCDLRSMTEDQMWVCSLRPHILLTSLVEKPCRGQFQFLRRDQRGAGEGALPFDRGRQYIHTCPARNKALHAPTASRYSNQGLARQSGTVQGERQGARDLDDQSLSAGLSGALHCTARSTKERSALCGRRGLDAGTQKQPPECVRTGLFVAWVECSGPGSRDVGLLALGGATAMPLSGRGYLGWRVCQVF